MAISISIAINYFSIKIKLISKNCMGTRASLEGNSPSLPVGCNIPQGLWDDDTSLVHISSITHILVQWISVNGLSLVSQPSLHLYSLIHKQPVV